MNFKNIFMLFITSFLVFSFFVSCNDSPSVSYEGEENYNEPDNTIDVKKLDKAGIEHLSLKEMVSVIKEGGSAVLIEGSDENWSGFSSGRSESQKGVFVGGRKVRLNAYQMGKYEVTQELYGAVMGKNPSYCRANVRYPLLDAESNGNVENAEKHRPVENVSWYHAVAFCNELTRLLVSEGDCVYYYIESKDGVETRTVYSIADADAGRAVSWDGEKKGFRLPTEAEWEFAARGGDGAGEAFKYSYAGANTQKEPDRFEEFPYYDDKLHEVGWYKYNLLGNSSTKEIDPETKGYGTHTVGGKTPNTLGAFDMSGNVWEWCWDIYNENARSNDSAYQNEEGVVVNPLGGVANGSTRVCRGGSWRQNASSCSVSYRNSYPPDKHISSIGFRLARSL